MKKCYYKPNRTRVRHYTARDCGRIVCNAIANGANKEDVFNEVKRCLGDPCQNDRVKQFIKLVLEAMAAILLAMYILRALLISARVLLVIARRIPLLAAWLQRLENSLLLLEDSALKARDITAEAELLQKIIGGP